MFLANTALINWSRAQFALTAMYHWLFVPLTLGLGIIMALAETKYYRTGEHFWKETAKFWQKIFGINFAIGVATGIILEFEFGTNWSNYSWFVGDIFGAPLAIEGILAFFMEATFIAVMFFGWDKVSKRFHLASTWLTIAGATISAWWILVANAWMQYPAGMDFNPDTVRNEMTDFWAVAGSPVAVVKFFHTVISSWILGAVVAIGIAAWYLLKRRQRRFAIESMKMSAGLGLLAVVLTIFTGHLSANNVAEYQPMKLAAMENLYEGQQGAPLSVIGLVNPAKKSYDDGKKPYLFNIGIPKALSFLSFNDFDSFVPGVKDIIEGGYTTRNGEIALSAKEKMERGRLVISTLSKYREAKKGGDEATAAALLPTLKENFPYFGYGYIDHPQELVPHMAANYYAFRIMVALGMLFLLQFAWILWRGRRNPEALKRERWFLILCLVCIPLVYICSQAGWIVAEMGRQPWTIQDILPLKAAISKISSGHVMTTFFVFLVLFTGMLVAEISIMIHAIKKGPKIAEETHVKQTLE